MTASTSTLPGYLTGRWTISPVNSDVSFTVRHLGVSRVHGRLSIRDVSQPVRLAVRLGGFGTDPAGPQPVLGLSGSTTELWRR